MLPKIENNNEGSKTAADQRDDIFNKISASLRTDTLKPIADTSVVKIVTDFTNSLKEANKDLLEDMVEEDKKLLKETVAAITKLQGKTVDSIKSVHKLAERLILSGQTNNNPQLERVGQKLKESALQEQYKAAGATLFGEDDTLKNRLVRSVTGTTKKQAFVQGTSIFGQMRKDASRGFRDGLGFGSNLFVSDEERREDVRQRAEMENKQVAFAEQSSVDLARALELSSENASDETKNSNGQITTSLSSSNDKPDGSTKSDTQEVRAGVRDTDKTFSRSATITGEKDHWQELMDILEKIRKCVCECQCGSGMGLPGLPLPLPVPVRARTAARAATAAATGATAAAAESAVARTATRAVAAAAAPLALSNTATAAESLALPAPKVATAAEPLALPAPKVATAAPLQLTQQRAGVTLEELGLKQPVREKVSVEAVRGQVEPKTAAQKFYSGEMTADQAREAVKANRTKAIAEGTQTKGASSAEPIKATAQPIKAAAQPIKVEVVESKTSTNPMKRYNESTDQFRDRKKVEIKESQLQRKIIEDTQRAKTAGPKFDKSATERFREAKRAEIAENEKYRRGLEQQNRNKFTKGVAEPVAPKAVSATEAASSPRVVAPAMEPLPSSRAPVPVGEVVPSATEAPLPSSRAPVPVATPATGAAPVTGTAEPVKPFYKRVMAGASEAVGTATRAIGRGAAAVGRGAMRAVRGTVDFTKRGLNTFGEAVGQFGNKIAQSRLGKAVAGSSFGRAVGKVAKSSAGRFIAKAGARLIPLVAPAIGAYEEGRREYKRTGSMTRAAIVGGISGVTSLGGELLGTAAGAVGGTAIAPGVGTIGLGLAGGAAGAYGGQKLGGYGASKLTDFIFGDPNKKKKAVAKPVAKPAATMRNSGATMTGGIGQKGGIGERATQISGSNRLNAGLETGKNQDANYIERGTNITAPKQVINVPPPTVIQQPAPKGGGDASTGMMGLAGAQSTRSVDSSWMRFQERRAVA